jgi:hypothetical protein
MHFHVHDKPAVGKDNFLLLTQALSTVIVDLFRMIYVMGSKEARAANMSRFDIFFDVADDHIRELHSHLTRLSGGITAGDLEVITRIDRNCLWVLGQIKRRNDINFDLHKCFFVMSRAADDAYEVFSRLISEELSRVEGEVIRAFNRSAPRHRPGSIESLRLRFSVQSEILAQQPSANNIRTIAHDSEQSYALHYFLIDHRLVFDNLPDA